eukprot:PhF_6_TR6946/c0_g1_i1/m.10197/K20877/NEK8; NIMA (never in mitosis gene a)-related kinase 8
MSLEILTLFIFSCMLHNKLVSGELPPPPVGITSLYFTDNSNTFLPSNSFRDLIVQYVADGLPSKQTLFWAYPGPDGIGNSSTFTTLYTRIGANCITNLQVINNKTGESFCDSNNTCSFQMVTPGAYWLNMSGLLKVYSAEAGCPGIPPSSPLAICSHHGTCDPGTQECTCDTGYDGPACEQCLTCSVYPGVVLVPTPKYHAAVVVTENVLTPQECCTYATVQGARIGMFDATRFVCTLYYSLTHIDSVPGDNTTMYVILPPPPTTTSPPSESPEHSSYTEFAKSPLVFDVCTLIGWCIVGFQGLATMWLVLKGVLISRREQGVVNGPGDEGDDDTRRLLFNNNNGGGGGGNGGGGGAATSSQPRSTDIVGPSYKLKYKVKRKIGQGAFGCTYLVQRRSDGLQCAMKLITSASVECLWQEYSATRDLQGHPGIVAVHDTYFSWGNTTRQSLCIVMEYFPKGTLLQLLRRGQTIPVASILSYAQQICSALDHIHSHNLRHGDIKPSNILVSADEKRVVVTDLGLSSSHATKDSEVRGTLRYMAPEHARGHSTQKSDVWSLGCVLLDLCRCGRLPPDSPSFFEVTFVSRISNEEDHSARVAVELGDTVPPLVRNGILKLLSINESERPTAAEAEKIFA